MQKSHMAVEPSLIANGQPSVVIEPSKCSFYDPPVSAQPLCAFHPASGYSWSNTSLSYSTPAPLEVVPLVSMQLARPLPSSSAKKPRLLDGLDGINYISKSIAIVDVSRCADYCKWNSLSVHNYVALGARFTFVRRIWPCTFAPFLARTVAESTEARDQSILPASPSLSKRTWCSFCQTPARCHSPSLRQQVMPLPQPSSGGSIFHWIPDLSTNTIPVSVARSGTRGRPPLAFTGLGGNKGAMTSHNSSGKIRRCM